MNFRLKKFFLHGQYEGCMFLEEKGFLPKNFPACVPLKSAFARFLRKAKWRESAWGSCTYLYGSKVLGHTVDQMS